MNQVDGLFVAEIGIPAALHAGARERRALEVPTEYGFVRGWWSPWHQPLVPGAVARPTGVRLVAELLAENLIEAEDLAIANGGRIARLLSFFAGSPAGSVQLIRIASTDIAGRLTSQHEYYYDFDRAPSVQLAPEQLRDFLRRFAMIDPNVRVRLERAIHWYASSISDESAPDSFLAAWIGLEAVGPRLNEIWHQAGVRVPCPTCQNRAGAERDAKIAGIEHLIRSYAPEILYGRSLDTLLDIRHDVAHGLRSSPEDIAAVVQSFLADLQLCLSLGILIGRDGPKPEPTPGWFAALPRDDSIRPDARYTFHCQDGAWPLEPFMDEWLDVERTFISDDESVEVDGVYERRARLKFSVKFRSDWAPAEKRYELFERPGKTLTFVDADDAPLALSQWRPIEYSAAWKRQMKDRGVEGR